MKNDQSQFNTLEDRLVDFAVTCISLSGSMKNSYAGQHLKNQLIRSGSSPALNYAEGRYAESKKDFIHKVKIVLKELYETRVCLKIINKSNGLVLENNLEPVMKECNELIAIFVASVNTAQKNLAKGNL